MVSRPLEPCPVSSEAPVAPRPQQLPWWAKATPSEDARKGVPVRGSLLRAPIAGPSPPSCRIPEPRADELLVSVRASSVNGIDRAIALGRLLATTEHEFPVVLGHDFAGVVERMGRDVATFWEGDEVYGFAYTPKLDARSGTWADCIVVPERSCSRRADNSGHSARRPPADT